MASRQYQNFLLRFYNDKVVCQPPGYRKPMVEDRLSPGNIEVERSVARIFHKLLNWRRDQLQQLGGGPNDIFVRKDDFVTLGKTLFKILDGTRITPSFEMAYLEVKERPAQHCRLFLEFDESAADLAVLPWEYLFYTDQRQGDFIAAQPLKRFHLIRGPFRSEDNPYRKAEEVLTRSALPLRLLLIIARPERAWQFETQYMRQFLQQLAADHPGMLEVEVLENVSRQELPRQLEDLQAQGWQPDLVHFLGHGRIEGETGQIALVKRIEDPADSYDAPDWIFDYEFANLLETFHPKPMLVFLQACYGAMVGDFKKQSGAALQVLSRGVETVVAIQNPIRRDIADHFAQLFYQFLLEGDDVAEAVTKGRTELAMRLHEAIGAEAFHQFGHKAFGSPVIFSNVYERLIPWYQPEQERETVDRSDSDRRGRREGPIRRPGGSPVQNERGTSRAERPPMNSPSSPISPTQPSDPDADR